MNNVVTYRTEDGQQRFGFVFRQKPEYIEIYCTQHPPLNGRPDCVTRHHLYKSGVVCFVEGKEPKTMGRALHFAKQFAEHYWAYVRTGEYTA